MFERFTDEARAVVVVSQVHARRLGHPYIGCEHLLLALASADDPVGQTLHDAGVTPAAVEAAIEHLVGGQLFPAVDQAALAAIGIDLDAVRRQVESQFGPRQVPACRRRRWWRRRPSCVPAAGHIPLTPRAKKSLELALREALAQHSKTIGTEHLALGLTRVDDSVAGQVCAHLGVSLAGLRAAILGRHRQVG